MVATETQALSAAPFYKEALPIPGAVRRFFVGGGPNAIRQDLRAISHWGGHDIDLHHAKHLQGQLDRAGVKGINLVRPGAPGQLPQYNREAYEALDGALPGAMGYFTGNRKVDVEALDKAGLGKHFTPEQLQHVAQQRTGLGAVANSASNLILGEAPFTVLSQRMAQGGLVGKGGVLTSDLMPGPALQRAWGRTRDAWQREDWAGVRKEIPGLAGNTALWLPMAGFGYGLPAVSMYGAAQDARREGRSVVRALGAEATNAATSLASMPLGIGQMAAFGPLNRAGYRLWDVPIPEHLQTAGHAAARPTHGYTPSATQYTGRPAALR